MKFRFVDIVKLKETKFFITTIKDYEYGVPKYEIRNGNVGFWVPEDALDLCAAEISKEEAELPKEQVNHPQHYRHGRFETIEEMRILFGDEAVKSFCILNAYKYKARAQYKGNAEEDLKKADWYLNYAKNMEEDKK